MSTFVISASPGDEIPAEYRFAQIPELLLTSGLPPRAIVLYGVIYMYWFRFREDGQEISSDQLATDMGCSRSTVYEARDALVHAGWLIVQHSGGRGRGDVARLQFNRVAVQPTEEDPEVTDPSVGESTLEEVSVRRTGSVGTPDYTSSIRGVIKRGASTRPRSPETDVPDDFVVTDKMREWAKVKTPHADIPVETEKFLNHHGAKGNRFRDWSRAWRKWMLNAEQFASQSNGNGSSNGNGRIYGKVDRMASRAVWDQ